jgi:hypothetical protein
MLGGEIPIDSSDDTNRRRILFYIIWTCLTIIFLCMCGSLHPNMPLPNQAILTRVWRTVRMMMICLVAPELPLGFAARRYVVARWFARSKKDFFAPYYIGAKVT